MPLRRTFTFFSTFLVLLYALQFVHGIAIEDLKILFKDKHCIEASLVSFQQGQAEPLMLDSSSVNDESTLNLNNLEVYKSVGATINELAQYNDIDYHYELISDEGLPHSKIYTVKLILGDETYEASASSLKKAKKEAAALALENTSYERPPAKIEDDKPPLTPTVVLNNVAMKLGLGVSYYLLNGKEENSIDSYGASDEAYGQSKNWYPNINSTNSVLRVPVEEPQISGPFFVKVTVANLVFKGVGHTVQAARHDAATRALQHMEKEALFKDSVCSKDETVVECKQKKESLKSPISRVYEAGHQRNLPVEFNLIREEGKPHKKVFITECKLGGLITEGEGFSKKESKRIAAEKMVQNFEFLPDVVNENAIVNGLSAKKKKKKKKMLRANDMDLLKSVSQITASLWGGGDETTTNNDKKDSTMNTDKKAPLKNKKSSGNISYKTKLLEIGNKLNIAIEFTDLTKQGDLFYSLMSMGVKPPHICLGKAALRESAHDRAALYGINYLHKSGIFEKTETIDKGVILDIEEIIEVNKDINSDYLNEVEDS